MNKLIPLLILFASLTSCSNRYYKYNEIGLYSRGYVTAIDTSLIMLHSEILPPFSPYVKVLSPSNMDSATVIKNALAMYDKTARISVLCNVHIKDALRKNTGIRKNLLQGYPSSGNLNKLHQKVTNDYLGVMALSWFVNEQYVMYASNFTVNDFKGKLSTPSCIQDYYFIKVSDNGYTNNAFNKDTNSTLPNRILLRKWMRKLPTNRFFRNKRFDKPFYFMDSDYALLNRNTGTSGAGAQILVAKNFTPTLIVPEVIEDLFMVFDKNKFYGKTNIHNVMDGYSKGRLFTMMFDHYDRYNQQKKYSRLFNAKIETDTLFNNLLNDYFRVLHSITDVNIKTNVKFLNKRGSTYKFEISHVMSWGVMKSEEKLFIKTSRFFDNNKKIANGKVRIMALGNPFISSKLKKK